MRKQPFLLLIGGTGRNVGKTTLACEIISKYAREHSVTGIKITSIFPDEEASHGEHTKYNAHFSIWKETRYDSGKDTSRMLQAGAKEVFYVQSSDTYLEEALRELFRVLPQGTPIVCESNSLRNYLEPGVFILVGAYRSTDMKPRARQLLPYANYLVSFRNNEWKPCPPPVQLTSNGWIIQE